MIAMRATILLSALLLSGTLATCAQDKPAETLKPMARDADPSFEVATIKPADPSDNNQGFRLNGHRISIEANTMTSLICFAYSIQKTQIVNAPSWFNEQRWNIDGVPDTEGKPNPPQYRRMLQKLLATRFGLQMHPDKRELSGVRAHCCEGRREALEKSKSDPDALPDSSGHGIGHAQTMKFTNLFHGRLYPDDAVDGGQADRRPDPSPRALRLHPALDSGHNARH